MTSNIYLLFSFFSGLGFVTYGLDVGEPPTPLHCSRELIPPPGDHHPHVPHSIFYLHIHITLSTSINCHPHTDFLALQHPHDITVFVPGPLQALH